MTALLPESLAKASGHLDLGLVGTGLLISDTHIPFHDVVTIELAIKKAVDEKVKWVVLNGDIADFHGLSRFDKRAGDPSYKEEIDAVRQFMAYLRYRLPKAEIVCKEGNHEERLYAYLYRKAPELWELDELTMPALMDLPKHKIRCIGERKVMMLGKYLHVLHGHEYTFSIQNPVNPARGLFLRTKDIALCFPAGTTILCRAGIKNIEDVTTTDEVLTHNGSWKRVVATQRRLADSTVTLKGQGHPGLQMTPEHPLRVRNAFWNNDNTRNGFAEPEWMPASDSLGYYWMSPCTFPHAEIPPIEYSRRNQKRVVMSPKIMWLVGRWIGDGWASKNLVDICCSHDEKDELHGHIREAGFATNGQKQRATHVFSIGRGAWSRWLSRHFGKRAYGKTIPAWALGMDAEYRTALLQGYLSADGSVPKPVFLGPDWECTTVSRKLAIGIKLLAQSLGYQTTLFCDRRRPAIGMIDGRKIRQRMPWRVKAIKKFRRWSKAAVVDNHLLGRIKSITNTGPSEVFNLTVEGDSSYIADGLVVHNCSHFHQSSEHTERTIAGTQLACWSIGCACGLSPLYMPLNKWNNGFAMVDVTQTGGFVVRNYRVVGGKVV